VKGGGHVQGKIGIEAEKQQLPNSSVLIPEEREKKHSGVISPYAARRGKVNYFQSHSNRHRTVSKKSNTHNIPEAKVVEGEGGGGESGRSWRGVGQAGVNGRNGEG